MVVLEKHDDTVRLATDEERIPKPNRPLVPSHVIKEFGEIAESYGSASIACDLHYIETVREHVDDYGLELLEYPSRDNDTWYVKARVLLAQGSVDLTAASPRLIAQLKATTVRPTENGLKIEVKRSDALAHGDIVSAFVCALWALEQDTPDRRLAVGARRFGRGVEAMDPDMDYGEE